MDGEHYIARVRRGVSTYSERSPQIFEHIPLSRILGIVVGLAAWEWYTQDKPAYLFPGLGDIYEAFLIQIQEQQLLWVFFESIQALFVGFVIAAIAGVVVGLAMGLNHWIEDMLNPYINAFYVAPVSAMVPIIILIGGPTFESRVLVVFLFCIFEMIINTYEGAKTTPRRLIDSAKSFGAGRSYVIRKVVFPHNLPYIFTGLRLSIGRGIKGMILAELLIEFVNLGGMIRNAQAQFQTANVLSIVVLLMVLGIVLTWGVGLMGNYLIRGGQ